MKGKEVKVLIVDDEPFNRILLQEIFEESHPEYELLMAENGQAALDIVLQEFPDLILLDIMMPGMDGYEVCAELKKDESVQHIPVILITALEETHQKVKGFEAGAVDYIVKPINEEETKARVEAHLRIKQYHDELEETNIKLKTAQNALVESAKMSAIGSLAAGVSHEFNNILTMMGGHVQLASESGTVEDYQKSNEVFGELVSRGKEITRGLLSFAYGAERQEKVEVDIARLIKNDLILMNKLIRDNKIELKEEIDSVGNFSCYPNQLSQVFLNVCKNAIDAMEDQERKVLTIRVECQDSVPEGFAWDDPHRNPSGKFLIIAVSDTGNGIVDNIRDKIFEPFVTTKGVIGGGDDNTPGTGLGLSIAFGIVKRHRGAIVLSSNQDNGTTITITIPMLSC